MANPQCLVRLQVISVTNFLFIYLKRHHSTKHEKIYEKYHGTSREAILKKLKGNQTRNQRGATGQVPPLKRFALKMFSPCSYFAKGLSQL